MSILYYEEHCKCVDYVSENGTGFKHITIDKGTIFEVEKKKHKHLFFFLKGSVMARYNEFPNKVFNAGEVIFIPKSADCYGEALTECSFIVLSYENSFEACSNERVKSVFFFSNIVKYDFLSLPVKPELMQYLTQLCLYLDEGINCRRLYEIKQKELFLVLRWYYKKEELAQLFFSMLGKSMDFRSKVMSHYMDVKTVSELATCCGFSEKTFRGAFLEEFGKPPYQWIQKQKSKHIIGRLAQQNIPIKEIVDEFNFSSASHFHKYCIRQYGESPIQVRRKLSVDNQSF